MYKILIVEDDEVIAKTLKVHLENGAMKQSVCRILIMSWSVL